MNSSPQPDSQEPNKARQASMQRRREALRMIGKTGAAAGAASPLAALATGMGRQWCHNSQKGKKVHATVSGCNSVVMSPHSTKECYGKPCSHYGNNGVPADCTGSFRDRFTCVNGAYDSKGKQYRSWETSSSNNGCLFHKSFQVLCRDFAGTPEAIWAAAYCNAASLASTCKFPYTKAEVNNMWKLSDAVAKAKAHDFFKNYMMNG